MQLRRFQRGNIKTLDGRANRALCAIDRAQCAIGLVSYKKHFQFKSVQLISFKKIKKLI